jgi:hypothetical protein
MEITKGSTFEDTIRWATDRCVFAPITAIAQSAPCVITSVAHGLVDGWDVKIESVKGMTEINNQKGVAHVISADSISIDCLNSLDFTAYTSGGVIRYMIPEDMTGFEARQVIKDRVGGMVLLTLSSATGEIVVDNVTKRIDRTIPASVTEALTWRRGISDLELFTLNGYVVKIIESEEVTVSSEV